ncbi:hypothetical protein MASR2M70_12870 [Bacillota bacterium]
MTRAFITTIPLQGPLGLEKYLYEPQGCLLESNIVTSFPIVPWINESINQENKDDLIKIICIRQKNEDTERNFNAFIDEIEAVGVNRNCVKSIIVTESQSKSVHTELLLSLINEIEDETKIYACMTFGTKTIPLLLLSMLNYAYKIKKHVSIEALVYGEIKRANNEVKSAKLYDVTSLIYFNNIVDQVSALGLDDPDQLLKQLLTDTM